MSLMPTTVAGIRVHAEDIIPLDTPQVLVDRISKTLKIVDEELIAEIGHGPARRIAEIIVRGTLRI